MPLVLQSKHSYHCYQPISSKLISYLLHLFCVVFLYLIPVTAFPFIAFSVCQKKQGSHGTSDSKLSMDHSERYI